MTTEPLIWPTTPLQQGLVALDNLAEPGAAYVGQTVVDLDGPLDLDALRGAIRDTLADQPHLHAGFLMDAEVAPVQFVAEHEPVVQVHDLDIEALLTWQRNQEWRLDEPPLLRWDITRSRDGGTALVLGAHHAVLDGWSTPLLLGQVARHYAARVGADSTVPPARGRYGDHLNALAARDTDAARRFWAQHLAHLPEPPAPPWLRPAPADRVRRAERIAVDLPGERSPAADTIRARLAARGLTTAALARTCWGLALDAVTGSPGTAFAVPVSTRAEEVDHADDLIGLTTDAVLVAPTPDPAGSVLDAAEREVAAWARTLPHQHVGLRGIHAALHRTEHATSLIAVESSDPAMTFQAGPVTFTLQQTQDDTHYPLAVTLWTGPAGECAELAYDAARVDRVTAGRLLNAFVRALAHAGTDTPVAHLDLVDAADRRTLEAAQSRPRQDPPTAPLLLPDALARVVSRHPDRTALVAAGPDGRTAQWTFSELAGRVGDLRERLLASLPADTGHDDAGQDDPGRAAPPIVGIDRPRGGETVIALLAVLDSGATALVLDPGLPAERREALLEELAVPVVIRVDGPQPRHDEPRGARPLPTLPECTACVVLTSGSTGRPKPVAVPHRALAHLLDHHLEQLHPAGDADPRQVAHTASFHFDAHWDALLALYGGHTVHVLAEDLYLDPFALAAYCDTERIDYLDLTPTLWSAMLAADAFERLPRTCVLGGEALPGDLWTRLRTLTRGTGSVALNLYGPTEATVDAAWAAVSEHSTPVVGRPLGRTGLLVLDDLLRRVPPGTPGELYLTGPQLAHGYLGLPGRSAERFVANPYPRHDAAGRVLPGDERMYRTGDLAHWTEDGLLVLGGRADAQFSLAGRRVEAGEIENVLLRHPAVSQAAVVLAQSVSGRGRLIAHVVPVEPSGSDLAQSVLLHCRQQLPAGLVPARILTRPALPLTRNGKLDRAALRETPADDPRGPSGGAADLPASVRVVDLRSHQGEALAAVRTCLAAVLGLPSEEIGADSDHIALGGDSITAIQLASRLRAGGWQVRAAEVLAARTARAIAAAARPVTEPADTSGEQAAAQDAFDPFELLTPDRRRALAADVHRLNPGLSVTRVLPLSPTQLGIYIDSQRSSPDPYRTTMTLRIDAPDGVTGADIDAGVAAWFARHESLRIGVWQGDLPRPIAYLPAHLDVPRRHLDATELGEDDLADLIRGVQQDELERDLSFDAARLAGYTWVRATGSISFLVVAMHHLLADGWSTPILASELEQHLREAGKASPSAEADPVADPPQDTVFASYLRWWHDQDETSARGVWAREFAGFEEPTLLGREATAAAPSQGSRSRRRARRDLGAPGLATSQAGPVTQALAAAGVTLATGAQGAWARVLARATGRTEVSYLLTSAGRPDALAGAEGAVGMFITTRPVRVDTARPAHDVLRATADSVARTDDASHLGLGAVTAVVGQVADTLVVVENYPRPQPATPGERRVRLVEGQDATTFPVTATLTFGDRLVLEVEVDPARSEADPDVLARAWAEELVAIAEGRPVSATPVDAGATGPAATSETPLLLAPAQPPPPPADTGGVTLVAEVMGELLETGGPLGTSFFEAGGDSILAVRLVGALRARGLAVGIADVFAAPTPAGLAARARPTGRQAADPAPPDLAGSDRSPSDLDLTPALAWYRDLSRRGTGRGFVQLREVALPADTPVTAVGAAAEQLLARHDALRLRVHHDRAQVMPARPVRLRVVAPSDLPAELRRLGDELDPAEGDLVRWAVTCTPEAVRVIVLAHHLGVDAVSWGILTDELRTLAAGDVLPAAPSFAAWARGTQAQLSRAELTLPSWRTALATARPLVDTPGAAAAADLGLVSAAREVELRVDPQVTAGLLAATRRGHRMEALLAAALTAGRGEELVVELEGHGRPTGTGDDRSNDPNADAVGWYTATWPVRLPGSPPATADPDEDLRRHLRRTARAVTAAAADGISYGLLRHLHPVHAEPLAEAERRCPPQVLLNYLGSSVGAGAGEQSLDPAALESELNLHADLPVSHLWELNAHLEQADGGPVLVARWQVAAPVAAQADEVLDRWQQALTCLAALETGPAPRAVHDAVGLGAAELDQLCADERVQAVWPPTPVQRGMIFQAAAAHDPYTSVLDVALTGRLDPERLRAAITGVVAAHPQLRLRVRWVGDPGSQRPVLVTVADDDVAWRVVQVSGPADAAALLEAQAVDVFDLERDPLLRATLVSVGSDDHHLVLSNHHVLLDGWSMPLLVEEVLSRYAGSAPAEPPDVARSPHARHLARTRLAESTQGPQALERRRALLAGSSAGPLTGAAPGQTPTLAAVEATLPGTGLSATAGRLDTTGAVLVATAWGAVLATLAGTDEAITGTVVSGRDADGEDTRLIGMLTDTVPVLTRYGAGRTVADVLGDVAGQVAAALVEPPVGLAALASALHRGHLLDTLLVVENYPAGDLGVLADAAGLQVAGIDGSDATHFPLALTVEDSDTGTVLRLEYATDLLTREQAGGVLAAVTAVLDRLAATAASTDATDLLATAARAVLPTTGDALRAGADSAPVPSPDDLGVPTSALLEVFSELFAGETVDADSNFFALGGDSILVMALVTACRERGLNVRPGEVFTAPTPHALAARARPVAVPDRSPSTSASATDPADRTATTIPAPLVELDDAGAAALDDLLRNL